MTKSEAIKAYSAKFGGFPYFLFMGADDFQVIAAVQQALKIGKEIQAPEEEVLY